MIGFIINVGLKSGWYQGKSHKFVLEAHLTCRNFVIYHHPFVLDVLFYYLRHDLNDETICINTSSLHSLRFLWHF
jgi:hypothetical protein